MDDKGEITGARSIDWSLVSGEDEAFYLRVSTPSATIATTERTWASLSRRGRMQTDDRQLVPRAKAWAKAIHDRFETVPVSATAPAVVPEPDGVQKMF